MPFVRFAFSFRSFAFCLRFFHVLRLRSFYAPLTFRSLRCVFAHLHSTTFVVRLPVYSYIRLRFLLLHFVCCPVLILRWILGYRLFRTLFTFTFIRADSPFVTVRCSRCVVRLTFVYVTLSPFALRLPAFVTVGHICCCYSTYARLHVYVPYRLLLFVSVVVVYSFVWFTCSLVCLLLLVVYTFLLPRCRVLL